MNDQDVIKEAYTDALKNLYSVLLDAYVVAGQDQHALQEASQRFKVGLVLARNARDAALALV